MRILLAAGEDGNAAAQPQSSPRTKAVDPPDRLVDADRRAPGTDGHTDRLDWAPLALRLSAEEMNRHRGQMEHQTPNCGGVMTEAACRLALLHQIVRTCHCVVNSTVNSRTQRCMWMCVDVWKRERGRVERMSNTMYGM